MPIGRGDAETSPGAPFGLDLSMAVFDRASRLAQGMFAASGASIILVHNGKIWRSRFADVLPKDDPVTEGVLKGGELFWVEDGRLDPHFANHPLVTGPPFLRFTVAVPVRLPDGSTPGVLSVSGLEPQPFDARKAARLKDIADFVADEWARAQAVAELAKSLRERDEALERSARSEDRLALALELSGVHVWELDYRRQELIKAGADDTFFCEPLTYEGLSKDVFSAIDPRDRAAVRAAWNNHIEKGTTYRPEHRINRPDGREVWVQSSARLFSDPSGRPSRIVGAVQDITARKIAEHALLGAKLEADAANKAKGAFLATMSHELRTPLNAILGFAEVIRDQIMGPVPDHYAGYARDIYESGRHLLDLVNDVLDISKLEAGRVELREEEFDVAGLLAEVVASFGKQAEASGIAIVVEPSRLPLLRADKRLIKQVLLNLISNALKFTPGGGRVTVDARRTAGTGMRIGVSDTGVGMSPAELKVALTPFGQVDSNIARRSRGTGLGLPISKSLAELHGGTLLVESDPGEGTRVTIAFPEQRVVPPAALLAAS